jgi:hypothetical protein
MQGASERVETRADCRAENSRGALLVGATLSIVLWFRFCRWIELPAVQCFVQWGLAHSSSW